MVKYIKQQQFQSLLPPDLDTLTLHEGGLPNLKWRLPLFRPLEYDLIAFKEFNMRFGSPCFYLIFQNLCSPASRGYFLDGTDNFILQLLQGLYSKGLNKGSPPLMFGSPPSWSVNVSSSGGSKL